ECRVASDVDGGGVGGPHEGPGGVDALAGDDRLRLWEVRCREADGAATPLPGADDTAQQVGAAQEGGGRSHVAAGQGLADAAAGNWGVAFAEAGDDGQGDAGLGAEFAQQWHVALAALAEAEVRALAQRLCVEFATDDLVEE